jgi:quercetin dioxygenase-like cupin family protein
MSANNGFTIKRFNELEKNGKWSLVRRSLGISSFGINVVTIPPGERIPEHNEAERDHEELFVVLAGSPTMIIDGERIAIEEGTYIRLDPEPRRYIENNSTRPATILVISAPRSSGYTPLSWA